MCCLSVFAATLSLSTSSYSMPRRRQARALSPEVDDLDDIFTEEQQERTDQFLADVDSQDEDEASKVRVTHYSKSRTDPYMRSRSFMSSNSPSRS